MVWRSFPLVSIWFPSFFLTAASYPIVLYYTVFINGCFQLIATTNNADRCFLCTCGHVFLGYISRSGISELKNLCIRKFRKSFLTMRAV